MKTILFSLILFSLFAACSKPHSEDAVLVRVKNETGNKITDVKVHSYTGAADLQKTYGTINENSASDYLGYNEMYSFPLLSYTIAGAGVVDIDRVRCASPLPPKLTDGLYTLVISGDYQSPEVVFVKD